MRRFLNKRLSALVLAVGLMMSLIPAALAANCPTGQHSWSGWIKANDSQHQHVCLVSGCTEAEVQPHTWGTAFASDDTHHWLSCTLCQAQQPKEDHDLLSGWQADASAHWAQCSVCGAKVSKGAHLDLNTDGLCDTCAYATGTAAAQSLTYTARPGEALPLEASDFNDFLRSVLGCDAKYVTFSTTDTLDATSGVFCVNYNDSNQVIFTDSNIDDYKFYYSEAIDGDYPLSTLTFVAGNTFSEPISLTFTAWNSSAMRASGTVTISPAAAASGDILYMTAYNNTVQLNANDFSRFLKAKHPSSSLLAVRIDGVPAVGGLYYNYYSASAYGTPARVKLTASNCDDQLFYFNPASTDSYALTELTYVPSSTNYCTAVSFTAYGSGNQTVTGQVLISVSLKTIPEVYGVTLANTAVSFPAPAIASAVSSATGITPASIQLLHLPDSKVGTVYVGSGTARQADTATLYGYSGGTWQMSQLRFVPASGYTGSVEIPYAACKEDGTPIAMGKFCLGLVNTMKKFSDISSSTWCYKYVSELSAAGVISGYDDNTFKPDNTISYGAALKLIMLAAGYDEQAPVSGGGVFSGYLAKARADGLITRTNVDLNKSITRLQIAQLAAGALKLDTENLPSVNPFNDTTNASVQALSAAGIVTGYFSNGVSSYRPDNTLTRGQVSAIVWRMRNFTK